MKLKIPLVLSQRDQRWASVLLGYNTNSKYSIGNYGCLITCLAMYQGWTPDYVNDRLKAEGGFTSGSGNFIWGKSQVLGLTEQYVSPEYSGPVSAYGINKIKELLDSGYPLLCEIDFNPATTAEEMHFVLLCGYDGDNVICADSWTGEVISLDVYGGAQRAIIQFRAYNKTLQKDVQIDLQKELDKCRKERDRNCDWFTGLCDIMQVGHSYDVAEQELKKLMNMEDVVIQKEKQLEEERKMNEEMQKEVSTLQSKVIELSAGISEAQEAIAEKDAQYQKDKAETQLLLETYKTKVTQLEKDIEELKKVEPIERLSGWELLRKALRKLIMG